MRRFIFLLLLVFPLIGFSQCRMSYDQIQPVITRYNPFFTDHNWDNQEKVESARLDPWRLLVLRQKACIRHHILLTMLIDKAEVFDSKRYWVNETLVLMKRVFFEDPSYLSWKRHFEVEFIKNFLANGTNKLFNFPVGERTFICKVEVGNWGAKIRVEMVKLLIREKIRKPGIARKNDDGWFNGKGL